MTNNLTLIIVTLGTLASGWIGAGINLLLDQPHQAESLGTLVWLITPLLLVLAARLMRRASSPGRWAPRFRQAWRMYAVALLAFPVVTAISMTLAGAIGQVDGSGLKWETLLPVVLLHSVEDATVNPLILDGHLRLESGAAWWASPVVGLLPASLYLLLGLGLRAYRLRSERAVTALPVQVPAGDRRVNVSV